MSASPLALVEPSVLRWARESIDLSPEAAARKIGVPDDRVQAWEAGEAQPTIAQLRKAAEAYKRSLAVFFLPAPPAGFDTLRDFRRHERAGPGTWSPGLHEDYRRAHMQRDLALELYELEDVEPPSKWRIDPLPATDEELANAARQRLLSITPVPFPSGSATVYDHINTWVAALETAGVMVLASAGGRRATRPVVLPVARIRPSAASQCRLVRHHHRRGSHHA
jgi:transcriptional regulator with XRE-family HTH domain